MPSGGIFRRTVRWLGKHPFKTALLLLCLLVVAELASIPYVGVLRLADENPGETALMQQRMDETLDAGKRLRIRHQWIPLSRIPRVVVDAVIVAEDGTFYTHNGVDWFEVRESIEKDFEEGRAARGASTITQQLAKNLFLSTSKDPVRKLKELLITFLLEQTLSKNRILELYLNEIEWGPGIFGIEAASEAYFGKPADALSLDEATRLAAVIPSPLRHRPDQDSRYVMRRKQIVLARMVARNMTVQPTIEETPPSLILHPQVRDSSVTPDTTVDTSDTDEGDNDGL